MCHGVLTYCMVYAAAGLLKRPRTPPANPALDYQSADSEHIMKRGRAGGQAMDEVFYYISLLTLNLILLAEQPCFTNQFALLTNCQSRPLSGKLPCWTCSKPWVECLLSRGLAENGCPNFEPRVGCYEHGFSSGSPVYSTWYN